MILIGFALVFCPLAHAENSKRLDFLLRFYDLNEAGYAYHRHCLGDRQSVTPEFQKTVNLVVKELLAQSEKENPHVSLSNIKKLMSERRYAIQYKLDTIHIEKGCATQETQTAKNHYEKFSRFNQSEVLKFINDSTRI